MFPQISHLNDLLPFVEQNKQIRVKVDEDTGLTIVCYMVQDEDTFAGQHEHLERECRGITFYQDGRIASRTMHKFFNIGQRDDVRPENIDWSKVTRIMMKRDGSMVTPIWVNGDLRFKTKKTSSSKEAALALEICNNTNDGFAFCLKMSRLGLTPSFEMTSPKFPIVLKYEKDELTLLHVRENVSGRYLSEAEIEALGSPFPIVENLTSKFSWIMEDDGIPTTSEVRWDLLLHAAMTTEGIEGWVIQFDQEMIKLKTKWYCDLHHSVTFTRWRDIARSVLADQSDDLKGAFAMTGRSIEPIIKVEEFIASRCRVVQNAVELHVENGRALQRSTKDMALALKNHELFGLIMRAWRGQEVNYFEFYEKNYLSEDWGLEVVGDDQ